MHSSERPAAPGDQESAKVAALPPTFGDLPTLNPDLETKAPSRGRRAPGCPDPRGPATLEPDSGSNRPGHPPWVRGDNGANLESTLADPAAADPAPASPARASVVRLGNYEILGELGRGGMGVVYHARHLKLRHDVALKMILAAGHASRQELARFQLEAAAVARLQHPNIVRIFEFGEEGGKPFFSLEFVDGGSLTGRLKDGPLPPREAATILEKLARAMHHAHELGIVHRDLKPANVLLTHTGEPKVADFGLAKELDSEDGLSRTGTVMGTPAYMAPEQAEGRLREVGPGSDVYALGAILYECLTGQVPFRATTLRETLEMVVRREPTPLRRLRSTVPRDLETVCLRCLEKDPARRYLTAGDLADDLGRFLRGEPVAARPVGSLGRTWRWCRRNPAVAGLLAAVVGALLLGATVSLAFALQARTSAREARQNADEASRQAQEANLSAIMARKSAQDAEEAKGVAEEQKILAD